MQLINRPTTTNTSLTFPTTYDLRWLIHGSRHPLPTFPLIPDNPSMAANRPPRISGGRCVVRRNRMTDPSSKPPQSRPHAGTTGGSRLSHYFARRIPISDSARIKGGPASAVLIEVGTCLLNEVISQRENKLCASFGAGRPPLIPVPGYRLLPAIRWICPPSLRSPYSTIYTDPGFSPAAIVSFRNRHCDKKARCRRRQLEDGHSKPDQTDAPSARLGSSNTEDPSSQHQFHQGWWCLLQTI